MSFFSGLFGDHSPFGRDCQEVETDPNADPFEKEICITMRQFEESFSRFPGFGAPVEFEDYKNRAEKNDSSQSRRDAILSRPTPNIREKGSKLDYDEGARRRREIGRPSPHADQNLDSEVAKDPSLLEGILQNDRLPSHSPPPFGDESDNERKKQPFSHSHSSSVIISTIRKPDGTIEQRRTVRDSDGNEEVTVSQYHEDSGSKRDDITTGRGTSAFARLADWLSGND